MGKSSIKNMVLDTFRSDRQQNVVAIEYNPWRFANRDGALTARGVVAPLLAESEICLSWWPGSESR